MGGRASRDACSGGGVLHMLSEARLESSHIHTAAQYNLEDIGIGGIEIRSHTDVAARRTEAGVAEHFACMGPAR